MRVGLFCLNILLYLVKTKNYFKLKTTFLLASFLFFSSSSIAKGIFFFDQTIEKENQKLYSSINSEVEKNVSKYIFYETPFIQLTKAETAKILTARHKQNLDPNNKIRIYVEINNGYDSLRIIGFSSLFLIKDSTSKPYNSEYFNYFIPLVDLENNLAKEVYSKLVSNLINELNNHLTENKLSNYKNTSFKIKDGLDILDASFFLFTCPEVYHYNEPFNMESKTKDNREAHKFISNNRAMSIDYQDFPTPSSIGFALKTSLITSEHSNSNSNYYNIKSMSNIVLTVSYDFIGLTFENENQKRTFWAEKNYVFDYLKSETNFLQAVDLYYKSSIRELFKPLLTKIIQR